MVLPPAIYRLPMVMSWVLSSIGWISAASLSGGWLRSASMTAMTSCLATAVPSRMEAVRSGCVRLSIRCTLCVFCHCLTLSGVPSVEPSSTIMTSNWLPRVSREKMPDNSGSIFSASFRVGIMSENDMLSSGCSPKP